MGLCWVLCIYVMNFGLVFGGYSWQWLRVSLTLLLNFRIIFLLLNCLFLLWSVCAWSNFILCCVWLISLGGLLFSAWEEGGEVVGESWGQMWTGRCRGKGSCDQVVLYERRINKNFKNRGLHFNITIEDIS